MRASLALRFAALPAVLASLAALAAPRPLDAQAGARERTIFASAVNGDGEPVPALGNDAFVVREDGVRREILRVTPATEPMDVALLVDNSAAINDELTFIREALGSFVARMAPGNQIAIVALADRPTIFADYTSDQERLRAAIGRVFPMAQSGMTLLDALFETSRGLGKRETPRAAIVAVFTDGPEFTNRYSRDVTAALVSARTALHLVTVGQFFHTQEQGVRERSFLLDEGPRLTGGQRISLLSPNGLNPAMQKLARELLSQYKVVYGRPESLIPPQKVEISSGRSGVTVRGAPARDQGGA